MKDPNNPIFARRTARNWSRAHLAALVGASTRSIQLWETNRRIPNHDHAVKLAEVFGCRPSRFQVQETGKGPVFERRIAANVSRSRLAKRCGVTYPTVVAWESGACPSPKNLRRLAAVLGGNPMDYVVEEKNHA